MKKIQISPSILSADFSQLGNEIKRLEEGGADLIHVDVMDGHFVPNLTIGPPVIKNLRKYTNLPFDVHLMISPVHEYIENYAEAGAKNITIHQDYNENLKESRNLIKKGPEVNNLFREIIETLDENGEELLADNILLRCNKLGLLSKKLINEQRDISANKIINKYAWITGGVILVTPLPVIDFLTTTSVNIQMILDISKVYDIKITKKEASELSKSLI